MAPATFSAVIVTTDVVKAVHALLVQKMAVRNAFLIQIQ
uniref:Uncharacterized protein n=1 Tax=Romanomermis culicivorax TaxID=13658 RepID=A0A915JS08_ROMCU